MNEVWELLRLVLLDPGDLTGEPTGLIEDDVDGPGEIMLMYSHSAAGGGHHAARPAFEALEKLQRLTLAHFTENRND